MKTRTIETLSIALATFLAICTTGRAFADTEVVDGITWTYTVSGGNATVGSASGWSLAIPSSTTGDISIPTSLGGCPVTSIGGSAFTYCRGLTSVTIPEGVTSVGILAFHNCSGLTNVAIPSSVTSIGESAFLGCSGLKSMTMPEGVKSIGSRAFSDCSGITSVAIPSSVTSINGHMFSGCSALEQFTVAKDNAKYKAVDGLLLTKDGKKLVAGVNGDVTIPSTVTSVDADAFFGHSALTSISIPTGLTYVDLSAFAQCGGITNFTVASGNAKYQAVDGKLLSKDGKTLVAAVNGDAEIPGAVTSIGDYAFSGRRLSSVTIPEGVTRIGNNAFEYCSALTNVTISEGVTRIGVRAFEYCSALTNVAIPSSMASIGDSAFYGCNGLGEGIVIVDDCVLCVNGTCPSSVVLPSGTRLIAGGAFSSRYAMTSVRIPESVTSIGSAAFAYCSGLTSVTIPSSVTNIDFCAFYYCSGLTSVTIPSSVTSIAGFAFGGCSGLTSVTIPEGVTSIGDDAFYNCSKLTSVTIPEGVTSIGDYAFYYCSGLSNIVFLGNAPEVRDAFAGVQAGCSATVYKGTTGWDDDGDGMWQGLTLVYRDRPSPIPALGETATKEEVAEALSGSADEKLAACITNAATYSAYREWAETVKGTNGTESAAGAQAVKNSPTAWVSFALGSEKLLEEAPKTEDLTVEAFEPTSESGQFDFTVSIEGVDVGSGATTEAQVERVKENLKQVLGLEGATSLDAGAFSSGNVDITFDTPKDGKVKFTAGPKTASGTFFMKVKVK